MNAKQKRYERMKFIQGLNWERFESTSIFNDPIGSPKLDPYTRDQIKSRLRMFVNSWIENDAMELFPEYFENQ